MTISRKGTPTRNNTKPTKTPATVMRNCFIGRPAAYCPRKLVATFGVAVK
jgi:hypothetical protein